MARLRNRKAVGRARVTQQPIPPGQDDSFGGLSDHGNNNSMEKDDTELELEKLVFGDNDGFRENLRRQKLDTDVLGHSGVEEDEESNAESSQEGFADVKDADLFVIDTGPSKPGADLTHSQVSDDEDTTRQGDHPAWIDSDDGRITVSLASNPRLRKLRVTENEDIVNGKDYTRRLRRQFERLNPTPDWAKPLAKEPPKKKRRRASGASTSTDDFSDEAFLETLDADNISAQPLAQLLQSTDFLTTPTTSSPNNPLRPSTIDIHRLKDIPGILPSPPTTLTFHPLHPILLSTTLSSSLLTLHHISPTSTPPNPTLTTLHIPSHPLTSTSFLPPHGSKIFLSSRRRYFHTWDLASGTVQKISRIYGHADNQRTMERFKLSPCGRWMGLVGSGRKGGGTINILDARTCQWVAEARVEGRGGVADFDWWGDGEGLCIAGKGGEVVEWSVGEKRVVGRWTDEGAVGITVLALGGNTSSKKRGGNKGHRPPLGSDRWVAIGSQSGIVNIYDRSGWLDSDDHNRATAVPAHPKPTRVLDQLVTPISMAAFSPDGQVLCVASRWKRDALRLVHLPSCTVFRNWPTSGTPLGRVTAVAWGVRSDVLAVGNEQGKIRLWEMGR